MSIYIKHHHNKDTISIDRIRLQKETRPIQVQNCSNINRQLERCPDLSSRLWERKRNIDNENWTSDDWINVYDIIIRKINIPDLLVQELPEVKYQYCLDQENEKQQLKIAGFRFQYGYEETVLYPHSITDTPPPPGGGVGGGRGGTTPSSWWLPWSEIILK